MFRSAPPRSMDTARLLAACLVLVAPACLGGCATTTNQRAAATKFGAATTALATAAADEFKQSRADAIEMNKARRRLGDTTIDPAKFDVLFETGAIEARVAAADALARYGTLISGLINGSQSNELKTSADALVGSLTRLNTSQDLNLTDAQLGAIGSAVQLVGSAITDAMRLKAAREIASATRPAVRGLADKLKRDFTVGLTNPDGSPAINFADQYLRGTARNLERAVSTPLPLSNVAASASDIDAARVLAAEKQARFRTMAAKIVEAADTFDNAQNELERALADPSLTLDDIDAFVAKAEELVRISKILAAK